MTKFAQVTTVIAMTFLLGILGTMLTNPSSSLAQDSSAAAIKNKQNRRESSFIVKQFERTSPGKEKVWLIYDQITRRVVVAVVQGKDIATYAAQVSTPYTNGIEIDLRLSEGSPTFAGEALHLQINGSNDGKTFTTNEIQLIFPDQIMSWSATREFDGATRSALPYEPPSGEAELKACVEGCTFTEAGKYEVCVRHCITTFGIK